MTFFNFALFPILNSLTGFCLLKSVIHLKVFSTIFLGSFFLFGIITQRFIYYYRNMIIKDINFITDETLGIILKVKLLSGKILSDSLENIKIRVTNNDYISPEYVFTSRDINNISYFIKIKNEEFYISRRLLKICDLEAFYVLINTNRK